MATETAAATAVVVTEAVATEVVAMAAAAATECLPSALASSSKNGVRLHTDLSCFRFRC